jgi:hypothetical protein
VHPVNLNKRPTTAHGRDDATRDEATIRSRIADQVVLLTSEGAAGEKSGQ